MWWAGKRWKQERKTRKEERVFTEPEGSGSRRGGRLKREVLAFGDEETGLLLLDKHSPPSWQMATNASLLPFLFTPPRNISFRSLSSPTNPAFQKN